MHFSPSFAEQKKSKEIEILNMKKLSKKYICHKEGEWTFFLKNQNYNISKYNKIRAMSIFRTSLMLPEYLVLQD